MTGEKPISPSPEGEGLVETKLRANGVYEMERAA
jgi:hypothetical protein